MIQYAWGPTAVGIAFLAMDENGVVGLYFQDEGDLTSAFTRLEKDFPNTTKQEDFGRLGKWLDALARSIVGGTNVREIPLALQGSPFQKRVWDALREIPRGSTTTYGALAESLGLGIGASRAVGTACGANPVAWLVPCHRVVPASRGLGGYRWGLGRKRQLLEIEQASKSAVLELPFADFAVEANLMKR